MDSSRRHRRDLDCSARHHRSRDLVGNAMTALDLIIIGIIGVFVGAGLAGWFGWPRSRWHG